MTTPPAIYDLAPLRLGTTVLAVDDLRSTPNLLSDRFQHSGNEFGSVMRGSGAAPRRRFSTPFYPAYSIIGLKGTQFTACDVYRTKFVSGIRSTTTARKESLAASCKVFAYMRGVRVASRGALMADVELVYLSNDGMTFPVTPSDGNTIPTLSSEPQLHTMGPASIEGVIVEGAESVDIDLGANVVDGIDGSPGDGLLYPTVCQYLGGAPVITVAHGDPQTVEDNIPAIGLPISTGFIQYFRAYDQATQLAAATGLTFTVAMGRVERTDLTAPAQRVAKGGFRVDALSATTTHPIAVASGIAVPSE